MGALVGIVLPLLLLAHPDSLTSTRIEVDPTGELAITQRAQVLSLLEVIEALDADGDGAVTPGEVQGQRAAILTYVLQNYRLARAGAPVTLSTVDLVHYPPGVIGGPFDREGVIDIHLRTAIPPERGPVMVTSSLFLETSPGHYDILEAHWPERAIERRVLSASEPSVTIFDGRRGPVFFMIGVEHILSGWDHLAFVLLLVLGARRIRGLIWTVTAFTVAHSITLAAAALQIIDPGPLGGLVEMGIALSIVYLAGDTLLTPTPRRTRAPEAFIFGLIHGLGFASFLRASLLAAESQVVALATFNLGVEAGQLLVVIVAAAALQLMAGAQSREGDGEGAPVEALAPRWVRAVGSAVILVLGLIWFFERW